MQESDALEARQRINNMLSEIDDLIDLAPLDYTTNELKKFIGESKIKDTAENREILEQLGILNMGTHKQKAVALIKKAYSIIIHELSELRDNKYVNTESYRDLIDLYKRSETCLYKQMACLFNPTLFNDITLQ